MNSVTSSSILWVWGPIECIFQNGRITGYVVAITDEFHADFSMYNVSGIDMSFTATGLVPNTVYYIQVAGRNSNGTGPFSGIWSTRTLDDGKISNYDDIKN